MGKRIIQTAEILCVGTELLIGDIVNTDAAFLSKELTKLGIAQYRQTVVGDNADRLSAAFSEALFRADLVILVGGLGPTYDDITKETVASVLCLPLSLNEDSLKRMTAYFALRRRTMAETNRKQAMMPKGAIVFPNSCGTADGLAIETPEGKTVILMPGPPREVVSMWEEQVQPYLLPYAKLIFVSHDMHFSGIGESDLEVILGKRMKEARNPTEAPYCSVGEVRIRVTASADTEEKAEALCRADIDEILLTSAGQYCYGVDTTMEAAVVSQLRAHGKTLFTAESCTGGLIGKMITDIPGASAVLKGGIISYTNEMKEKLLGVPASLIERYSEVSPECAAAMAEGARRVSGADIGVSVTGYAGPGAGVPREKVGYVCIGISDEQDTLTHELYLGCEREKVRLLAAKEILRQILLRLS